MQKVFSLGFCLCVCVSWVFLVLFCFFNEETTKTMVRGKKHGRSALQSHNALIVFSVRPHFPAYFMMGKKGSRGEEKTQ